METSDSPSSSPETTAKTRRPKRWQFGLLALLILLGGGAIVWRTMMPSPEAAPPAAAARGLPPTPVQTAAIQRGQGTRSIQLAGQTEANKSATLRTQTAGTVERVLVEVGDRVKPGMTIATLDDDERQLALAEAQAKLAQARSELARLQVGTRSEIIAQRRAQVKSAQASEREALDNYNRNASLVKSGAIAKRVLVEARASVDTTRAQRLQAEATLAESTAGPTREEIDAQKSSVAAAQSVVDRERLNLTRTQVKSPIDGTVQTREVNVGDLVQSRDPVVTLVNNNELDVFLELPEQLTGSVTAGLPVELRARALPDWRGRATISGVVPAANAASRRQLVRLRLLNPPPNLLPKMAIAGTLQLPIAATSLSVPRDALVRREENWLVYTVRDGKAVEVKVQMVADLGETVAISSPQLRSGQAVVVRGSEALRPGSPVQVVENQKTNKTS
ncbi:efflux RND transporter periplasmic adaptor subunit [Chamaesiphon polymorphus]|uniref:Efflux RND transporter periplasmic adaptor subunit n=1 Tax=Chamaesiphon polymorphus CCALA 037 TaxID=2107692 RepID=A0A2T1GM98_9CYAN|nr:efflux RND transporter periplasmic adaptor subunit [Chamaesiphon polymorphus]PSB59002.1 efflux RND transporter periplasmic adaptor subunit [Chamaesiphon polymorphus CCALA 037]